MLAVIDWSPFWPLVASGVAIGFIVRYLPKAGKALSTAAVRSEVDDAIKHAKLVTRADVHAAIAAAVEPLQTALTSHLSTEEEISRKNLAAQEATLAQLQELRDGRDRERDEIWRAIRVLQARP